MDTNKSSSRLLVVDDDESFLASMRRTFRGHFELTTTNDPVQAIKIFELQGPFAVVISDFQMPFMNGIQLFSRIVSINKHAQRIMLTGHADLQMAIDAVNHGKITAFLTKPTPAASIRSVVLDAIRAYNQSLDRADQELEPSITSIRQQEKLRASELASPLTLKEMEILALLAKGYSNEEISSELNITVGTAKSHLNNLFCKMDVNSRAKVVAKAIELGIIMQSSN